MPEKTKGKKPHKKERTKVPPDAFDEESGTKVLIAEVDEATPKEEEKVVPKEKAEKLKESEDVKTEDDEKVPNEESKDEPKSSENDDRLGESEVEDAQNSETNEEEGLEDGKEEKEVEDFEKEENEELKEDAKPSSFYEKVLGEKPPEKSEEDEVIEEEREGINKSLFFLGGVVFILTIIIASGVGYFLLQSYKPQVDEQVVEEVPTETPTPTPLEIDREGITFEVLNGSGQSGVAGRSADAIEALGYTADEVGNADSSDYSGVNVGFSEDVTEIEKKIILEDLKKEFLEAEEDTSLEPDGTDVIVIIGT